MSVENARADLATLPPAAPGALLRRLARSPWVARTVGGILILLIWEFTVRALAPAYVAKPSNINPVFFPVLTSATMLEQAWATLSAVAQGLAISIVGGTIIGLAMGRVRFVDRLLRVYVTGLYAMPMTAILPLISLWFGYTEEARLATVVFAAFFSIVVNVSDGARAVPPEFIEVSRSFRGSAWSRLFDVILPASVPYLLAGLRLAAGRALIGAVVAEYFTTVQGIGYYILFQARTFHHNEAFVGVGVLALSGVLFEVALRQSTARFLPWYRRGERGG